MIPKWLASVVPVLVKAGKCAEILKSNGVLTRKIRRYLIIHLFDRYFYLDNEQSQSFIEEFSRNLQENFNLKKMTWNSLSSIHNSEVINSIESPTNPFVSLNFSFNDLDNEKNSFLALALKQLQIPKTTLLEINQ